MENAYMAREARQTEAIALTTLPERVSVLEVKVTNIEEKVDDVKKDIKDSHDVIVERLAAMRDESTAQHNELAGKIATLEGIKTKWTLYGAIALAFLAGGGYLHVDNVRTLLKILGL